MSLDNYELYCLRSHGSSVHYFTHLIWNPKKFTKEVSRHIYTSMFKGGAITLADVVVIYHICSLRKQVTIEVFRPRSVEFTFRDDDLEFLNACYTMIPQPAVGIIHNYETGTDLLSKSVSPQLRVPLDGMEVVYTTTLVGRR